MQRLAEKYGEQSLDILRLCEKAGTGSSPDVLMERIDAAFDFYAAHNFRDNTRWIPGHLNGIDFNHHVEVVVLPKGTVMEQWQAPGGSQGSYYANLGTQPTNLGIHHQARDADSNVVDKTATRYIIIAEETPALHTRAAAIDDTWSLSPEVHPTEGGAAQYYSPQRDAWQPDTQAALDANPAVKEAAERHPEFSDKLNENPALVEVFADKPQALDTLAETAPKSLDEMTPPEIETERQVAAELPSQPSSEEGYLEETHLPNDHEWKEREDGASCRSSSITMCMYTGSRPDPKAFRPDESTGGLEAANREDPDAIVAGADERAAILDGRVPNDSDLLAEGASHISNPKALEELLARTDISDENWTRVRANLAQSFANGNLSKGQLDSFVSRLRGAKDDHQFAETMAELHHPNRLVHEGIIEVGSVVVTNAKRHGDQPVRLGSELVDIRPVHEADALYRDTNGILHLDEVKNTAKALRDKITSNPNQIPDLALWRDSEAGREVAVIIDRERNWTEIFGPIEQEDGTITFAIDILRANKIPLVIDSYRLSPDALDALSTAMKTKIKMVQKEKGKSMNFTRDIFAHMTTIEQAQDFLQIKLI